MRLQTIVFSAIMCATPSVRASIIFLTTPGTNAYQQDFSTFTSASTLPEGWGISGLVTTYSGVWGSTYTGPGIYGENVFGYQHTATTGVVTQSVSFQNNTGLVIDSLTISYTGEAARLINTRSPAYAVSLSGGFGTINLSELAYSTLSETSIPLSETVTDLTIEVGETFTISWVSDRDFTSTGSSRRIGISDFKLGVTAIPETGAATLVMIGVATMLVSRNRRAQERGKK